MAGGTVVFHRTITRKRALVGVNKSNSNTKSKTPFEGKTLGPSGSKKIRVVKISLTPPTSS
jgi:hypothetical protein